MNSEQFHLSRIILHSPLFRFVTGLFVLLSTIPSPGAELRLKSAPVRCTQTLVALGDIAEIVPGPEDDADRLRQVVLFTSPQPGENRTVDRIELRNLLSGIGIDSIRHPLTGARQIVLVGEDNTAREFVTKRPVSTPKTDRRKSGSEKAEPLHAVALRRSVPRGYVIGPSDVMLVPVKGNMEEHFFVAPEEVVGKETTTIIREQTILTPESVRLPTWVFKGDIVTVRSLSNGIVVRTDGTALQDGLRGDTIPIATIDPNVGNRARRSKQERATFLATVCAPKTVEVYATPIQIENTP